MNSSMREFRKEALVLFLVSLFVFALTCINLYSRTNTCVLSVISTEPAGYVGYYDEHYDASNADAIKQIITALEEDTADTYEKEIYVLDKDSDTYISSTGDISDAVKDQLTSKVNEKLIITCRLSAL